MMSLLSCNVNLNFNKQSSHGDDVGVRCQREFNKLHQSYLFVMYLFQHSVKMVTLD